MRKLTYNPDQLNDVAKLIWQHNRYLRSHPYIKSVDDVRSHILQGAKSLVCNHTKAGAIMSLGYCINIMRFSRALDEYEVEITFDPAVSAPNSAFITLDVDDIK